MPGRRQAAVRQPGPRRGHEPDHARAGRRRLRRRPRGRPLRSSSRSSPPATIIACWSSATSSSPPPAASRPRSSATASHTIAQLVDEVNRDPRRGDDHATVLSKIKLDADRPGRAGRARLHARLRPAGRRARADPPQRQPEHRRHGHRRDRARPSRRRRRAVDAARIVGLDIAGVDVVAHDISRPLEEQGGVIVEVNAGPGLRMHLEPSAGTPRAGRRGDRRHALPRRRQRPHPDRRRHRRQRQDDHHAVHRPHPRGTGRRVGMTCTDGIFIDDRRIDTGDCSGPQKRRKPC